MGGPSQEDDDPAHLMNEFVEIETIENQKENIQPIKSGRSAARLVSLFNRHHPHLKASSSPSNSTIESHQLTTTTTQTSSRSNFNPIELIQLRKKTHEKFQHQIRILEDALNSRPILNQADRVLVDRLIKDPMEIYIHYIRWTIESYPSGGSTAESRLIPLLEQVTRKFMNDRRYQQDLRYLKCWILYSDQLNTPTTPNRPATTTSRSTTQGARNDRNPSSMSRVIPSNLTSKLILNFLIHNRIGTKTGLLYQEYFKLFLPIEGLNQRSDQADRFKLEKVLKFGISQTSGDDQQVIVELLDQLPSIDPPPQHPDEIQISTDPEGNQKNHPNPKPTNPKVTQSKKSRSKTKMKVFEDLPGRAPYEDLEHVDLQNDHSHPNLSLSRTDGIQDESSGLPSPFSLISKWDNLGTVQSNKKQNTIDPSTWKGQKLPMIKSSLTYPDRSTDHGQPSTTSRPSKIKVYEDPFPADESYTLTPIETTSSHDLPPVRNQDPSDDKDREDDDHYKLLDDLLSSEIDHQVHSIHEHYSNDSERSEAYQVLRFDPTRFQSLKR